MAAWLTFASFVLPNLALIVAFTYVPLVQNIGFSTLDWPFGSDSATRIGLGNYVEFFTSESGQDVWRRTAIFTAATVGGSMVLGLTLALLLNSKVRGQGFFRATVFAPYVLSGVGVGLVALFVFNPTYGLLAQVMRVLGFASPQWILNPDLSLLMVIIVYVWKNAGYCALVYLAGLQGINQDVLDAAALDGASPARGFFSITLPLLSPTTFFLLVTTLLNSLQAFDLLRTIKPSGDGVNTLIFESYIQVFGGPGRAGYSAAISVVLFVVLLVVTLAQLRFVEKKVHYS
ncbi:sugar ABC transporter permease [Falsarthrobacter nasiphocae]|nr:sugar ABC transporter permease [Falsarthrobacter nasiphocae]